MKNIPGALNLSIKNFLLLICCMLNSSSSFSQLCNGSGNVVVFSNYDGSGNTAATRLNINVDVNIANLKIGIASYERVTVNIAGAFVGNVTAVRWAGYGATNNHCTSTAATVITGVPAGIITYVTSPPATVSDPLGNANIIGGYSCPMGNGGGSASMYQIVNYFLSAFGPGSTLRSSFSQYGCWAGATKNLSAGASGNCCPATPLPIELVSFTESCDQNRRTLNWTTSSEINNDYFTVERSVDAVNYEPMAEIRGAGNSNTLMHYEWVDESPLPGINYYRLSQTDNDGTTEYFEPISAGPECGPKSSDLTIIHNPTESVLSFQVNGSMNDEVLNIHIYDLKGGSVLNKKLISMEGTNIFMIDIESLERGVYFLRVESETYSVQKKFIKI